MMNAYDTERLRRLRSLAWLLDEAIPLPGGFRIGLDPIIGLIPGVGDAVGALFAVFIVSEARALGAPLSVIVHMLANVLIDALVGSIPFAGDLFDAGYKANKRNIDLLARFHSEPSATHRSSRMFVLLSTGGLVLFAAVLIAIPVLVIMGIVKLFS